MTIELWQVGVGMAGLLTPIVLAAMARDRSLLSLISSMKDDCRNMIDAAVVPTNERINRVRDEYVRRDDLADHLNRIEKQFDNIQERLDDIRDRLSS